VRILVIDFLASYPSVVSLELRHDARLGALSVLSALADRGCEGLPAHITAAAQWLSSSKSEGAVGLLQGALARGALHLRDALDGLLASKGGRGAPSWTAALLGLPSGEVGEAHAVRGLQVNLPVEVIFGVFGGAVEAVVVGSRERGSGEDSDRNLAPRLLANRRLCLVLFRVSPLSSL
jgi:hypothetical protein